MDLELTRKYTSYTNFVYQDISEWGVGSNPAVSDIATATLRITQVGGSYDSTEIDVIANYTDGTLTFTVEYDNGAIIPDGVYNAVLTVVLDDTTELTVTLSTGSYFDVQADLYKRIAKIPEYFKCNDCCNQFIKETFCMKMMLDALIPAAMYSDMSEFEDILDTLTQMLDYDTTWELT